MATNGDCKRLLDENIAISGQVTVRLLYKWMTVMALLLRLLMERFLIIFINVTFANVD